MLKYSIIVPTYNEEKDIAQTLDCLATLDYPSKEILVVDDSNDRTPEIVSRYADRGVRLIRPAIRKGRCEARNIGVRESSGDVLVILNADVHLPKDFLTRIDVHYRNGYDCVSVNNEIINQESLLARYIAMNGYWKDRTGVFKHRQGTIGFFWTEGFSVRREMALKTSLFPSGYAVPIEAGEDARFADELRAAGCKGLFDETINITHIAPSELKEYWSIRKGRGAGTPQIRRFLDGWSYRKIFLVAALKAAKRFAMFLFVVPMLYRNWTRARYSKNGLLADTVLFSVPWLLEQLAVTVGEFKSLRRIIAAERVSGTT